MVIRGDIESGASVDVKGMLLVEGNIGPSRVRVRGNLEVKGGIVSTEQGMVRVLGTLLRAYPKASL